MLPSKVFKRSKVPMVAWLFPSENLISAGWLIKFPFSHGQVSLYYYYSLQTSWVHVAINWKSILASCQGKTRKNQTSISWKNTRWITEQILGGKKSLMHVLFLACTILGCVIVSSVLRMDDLLEIWPSSLSRSWCMYLAKSCVEFADTHQKTLCRLL